MATSPRRTLRRRAGALLTVCVGALSASMVAPVTTPARAVPSYTLNEPAVAVAGPPTVFLEGTYTGYVRELASGNAINRDPVVLYRRCSGVVVNPDGYVVTTSACVRPTDEIILINVLYKLGRDLVAANELKAEDLDAFVADRKDTSAFTGAAKGSKPTVTLVAQLNVATSGVLTAPGMPATVTHVPSGVDGDVALVKVGQSNLPAIEIDASDDVDPGAAAVLLGYDARSGEDSGTYVIRTKTVEVRQRGGTNRLAANGEIGPFARGGPVVDPRGRLIALLDTDTTDGSPSNDLISVAHITRMLADNGVPNRLSDVDAAYRDALDAYFAGQFSRAIPKFDAILDRDPGNVAVRVYRGRAQERLVRDGDAVENSASWLRYALSVAAGVLIIGAIVYPPRLFARSARPAPAHRGNRRASVARPAAPPRPAQLPATLAAHLAAATDAGLDETVILSPATMASAAASLDDTVILTPAGPDDTVILSPVTLDDTVVFSSLAPPHGQR